MRCFVYSFRTNYINVGVHSWVSCWKQCWTWLGCQFLPALCQDHMPAKTAFKGGVSKCGCQHIFATKKKPFSHKKPKVRLI